ncbi:MAG TPA: MFS transporter [Thermoplasmata archaeon]|nr:MFS transporter [Thermoplasmata archaeon]
MAEDRSLPPTPAPPAGPGAPIPKTVETFDRAYANRIMLLLAGVVLVVLYIEGMLTPSLPTIQAGFGVDAAQVALVISAYAAAGVALSPVIGKLGDIYGKRAVMVAVMFTYAAAVTVTGFSPNFAFMVGARAVQGVGLTIMPLGMSLMREEFPREMVPRAQGILSAMFGIGFAVSLPLGSWVSQDYGWRWTYHSAVPFVILMAVLVFLLVKESPYRRPETRVDYLGALFLGLGLAGIVAALSQGEAWGWTSPLTLGFGVLGAAMFLPFALVERRLTVLKREPIVDVRLLTERNVAVTNVVLTVAGLGMYLALFTLIFQFEYPVASGGYNHGCLSAFQCNFGILTAGIDILPLAAGMTVVALVASVLVSRVGVKPLAILGGLVTALGFALEAFASSLDLALAIEVVVGAGIGLLNASIINLLVLTVDPRDMGQATAMNNVFRNVGGSVGAPIAGSLLATYVLTSGLATGFPLHIAFEYAFFIAAGITVAGTVSIVFAQEVLGARRHPKFAHLPTLARRGAPRPRTSSPVPSPLSETRSGTPLESPRGRGG